MVTGAAGFIGAHLVGRLTDKGAEVVGVDNLTDYYDPQLKMDRMAHLAVGERFRHVNINIADRPAMEKLFQENRFDAVVNLAAQPGVRYSLINPYSYVDTNIVGFVNLLEGCRHSGVKHFVYASSSSVYGANTRHPYSVHDNVDHPVSLYAASKKSNELMAHCYSHLYGIPATGLRFFTVYGPWGRPDMAYFSFTDAILGGKPINVFNHGDMERDFTYIDDIIEGICRVMKKIPESNGGWDGARPDPSSSSAPYKIYNIGNNNPEPLMKFISVIEDALGKKAVINFLPMQPGDVRMTCADIDDLRADTGYAPRTPIEQGIPAFVKWYREYYRV